MVYLRRDNKMKNTCILKDCRLRQYEKEIPEDNRDYSEDYPFNAYGFNCDLNCSIRIKKEQP